MSDNEEEKRMPESLNLNQGPSSYFNNLSAFNMPVYSMATKGMTAGRGRGGAKTRQTARMSTGGKYPTKRLAGYLHRNNENFALGSEDEAGDDLFGEDSEERKQTRTEFQKMDKPSEY